VFWKPLHLKWGVLGAKWGRGGAMLTHNELVFTFGGFKYVPILVKSIKKCERESACTRTHRSKLVLQSLAPTICYSYMGHDVGGDSLDSRVISWQCCLAAVYKDFTLPTLMAVACSQLVGTKGDESTREMKIGWRKLVTAVLSNYSHCQIFPLRGFYHNPGVKLSVGWRLHPQLDAQPLDNFGGRFQPPNVLCITNVFYTRILRFFSYIL